MRGAMHPLEESSQNNEGLSVKGMLYEIIYITRVRATLVFFLKLRHNFKKKI